MNKKTILRFIGIWFACMLLVGIAGFFAYRFLRKETVYVPPVQEREYTDEAAIAEFGKPLTFVVGEAYDLGPFVVRLKEIVDSRCPEGVACVWQGELAALFSVKENTQEMTEQLVGVSQLKPETDIIIDDKSVAGFAYHFTLQDISETEVSIMIETLGME